MAKYRLGDIAPVCQGMVADSNQCWLLNLDVVESNTGKILEYVYVDHSQIGASTVSFDKMNVLYSKLRPYLNKVVLPDRAGYATSEMLPLRPNEQVITREYLTYFLRSPHFVKYINGKTSGAKMPRANIADLKAVEIECPSIMEQNRITTQFDLITRVIEKRQKELSTFDNLIKARFVELFGDPVSNPKGWEKKALSEEAEIKIGPFGSLLHKEDYITGGHALVNPSHIVDGKIAPDDKLTISDEKYDELSAYHLRTGDVVMGRRGEMGRCAVVEQPGLLCGTGSLLIRTNGDLSADYIQKIISFPSFNRTIEEMAVGQTMPNLNVPIVSAFQIIKPPKSVQNQYYSFVAQVDKSKAVVQKALDKAQLLFDSLMQKYFG